MTQCELINQPSFQPILVDPNEKLQVVYGAVNAVQDTLMVVSEGSTLEDSIRTNLAGNTLILNSGRSIVTLLRNGYFVVSPYAEVDKDSGDKPLPDATYMHADLAVRSARDLPEREVLLRQLSDTFNGI